MIKQNKGGIRLALGILAAMVSATAVAGISIEPVPQTAKSLIGAWSDTDTGSVLLIAPGGSDDLVRISGQDRTSHWQGECRQTGQTVWACVAHGRMLERDLIFTYESTLLQRTDGDAPQLDESWTGRYDDEARKGECSFRRLDGVGIGMPAKTAGLESPAESAGELKIEVSPADARLLVDGTLLGSGSQTIRERAGRTVLIRAEADGHEPMEERVRVQSGQVTEMQLFLSRLPPVPVTEQ